MSLAGVYGHVRCVWQGEVTLVSRIRGGGGAAGGEGAEVKKRYYVFTDGMIVSEDDVLPPPPAAGGGGGGGVGGVVNLERRALLKVEEVDGEARGAAFKIVYKGGVEEVLRCGSAADKEQWVRALVRGLMQRGSRGAADLQVCAAPLWRLASRCGGPGIGRRIGFRV